MHDSKNGERVAGWFHFGYVMLYVIAAIWHLKAVKEHWDRI